MPSCRRTSATTSCDVIPGALSTSKTPSGDAAKDVTSFLQDLLFHVGERSFYSRAGRKDVTAAAKFFANRANIHLVAFRTHAHPDFAFREFLKKYCNDDAADRAQMIDQSFIVFGENAELFRGSNGEAETRQPAVGIKSHRAEEIAQQFNATPGIVFVSELADFADIDAGAHELCRNFQR